MARTALELLAPGMRLTTPVHNRMNLAKDPVMAEIFQMGTRRVALQRAGRGEK